MAGSVGLSKEIINVARSLHEQNMLAAGDGNISVRISDTEIWITPSGMSKARMNARDLSIITLDGKILKGTPSSERAMHLAIYRTCKNAKAVIHAHPPNLIAWTIAHPELDALPSDGLSELILSVGNIPIIPYARPGTDEMGTSLQSYLPKNRVLGLARHGGIAWGESLEEAHCGMERMEHTAIILKNALLLGKLTALPPHEIEYLKEIREKMGDRTR